MNKYYFVNIGAEVIWHPANSDDQKVMQVCTSVPHPVENDTPVSLIFTDKRGNIIHPLHLQFIFKIPCFALILCAK